MPLLVDGRGQPRADLGDLPLIASRLPQVETLARHRIDPRVHHDLPATAALAHVTALSIGVPAHAWHGTRSY
jgi:hypothetical protein